MINLVISILTGRLIPGVRHLISIPAGLAKMDITKFIIYTTIGAGLWNIILASIGYYLESFIPKEMLMAKVDEYSSYLSVVFIILGVLVFGFMVYRAIRTNGRNADKSNLQ